MTMLRFDNSFFKSELFAKLNVKVSQKKNKKEEPTF